MAKVFAEISMSLDGFITGPGNSVEQGLGVGGEQLHEWVVELESWRKQHGLAGGVANEDAARLEESIANTGAVVMGRRMFDHGEEPWGAIPPFRMPVFVVTHEARAPLSKEGGTTFTFITDGVASAFRQAEAAANGKDVSVAGGASVIQQGLAAGLIDELQIHLVPVLLGGGTSLFGSNDFGQIELAKARVTDAPAVTHLTFHVEKKGGA